MSQRELLRKKIEEERMKLNLIAASGAKVEDMYCQSLVVDRLIEKYMDCE